MAGLFGISVDPTVHNPERFLEDLFWGTFYQQHRREAFGGLATFTGNRSIEIRTHRGLFRPNFLNDLKGLEGTEGIGCCSPERQPYKVHTRLGSFSICFSGRIINRLRLIEEFKRYGYVLSNGGDDAEISAMLIVQGKNIVEGIKNIAQHIEGAFSLLILTEDGSIYAVYGPTGHWPLVIGQKEGASVVATESGGFGNLGFELRRDLKPGEIVLLSGGKWESLDIMPTNKIQICTFLWTYIDFPGAVVMGIPVSFARKRMGAALARRDIERSFIPDIVVPVPDSGRFHAIGYHQKFCRVNLGDLGQIPLYDEALIKYPYAGRSFTPLTQAERDREAEKKILANGECRRGEKAVVNDDSIVRGTQFRTNLIPKIKASGIKEVHGRISCPELKSHCPWGKSTETKELLATRIPVKEERARFLGLASLEHETIEEYIDAIGLPREKLCVDCCLPS